MASLSTRVRTLLAAAVENKGEVALPEGTLRQAIARWSEDVDDATFTSLLLVWAAFDRRGPSRLGAQLGELLRVCARAVERRRAEDAAMLVRREEPVVASGLLAKGKIGARHASDELDV